VLIAASSASCAIALGCTATASAHANAVHVSARSAGSQLTIAGNEGLTSDPFWISASCGGTRAAQANGAKMIWKGFTTNSTSADSTNVQDIQLLHPDGVIMSSPTSLTFATERKQWMSTGTPVAEINTVTADPNFYKAYTAAPTASSDLAFAKVIVKDIGKSGSFAILGGQAGIPFLEAVWKPVVATLHKIDPGVTVLPTQYDNFSTSTSATVVSGLITAHPDLKGIYSISGPEGTGVITALRQAGKLGKIDAFSGSGDPDLVSDLKAGDITALLAQSPYLMGYDAVKSLIGYLKAHQGAKGAVPHAKPQAVALSTFIVTHANVNSKSAKNYEYLTACKK
jgi:ribose transport system substrate-binding protein